MIFETHAHYDDDRFKDDRDETIKRVHEKGVAPIINVGASIGSTMTTIELAKKYDFIYAAVGVHPSDIADLNEETFAWLREQTAWERTVAVGEIGLDYYWDKEPNVQENQRYWFKRQLELAAEASLPVIIHSRDAAQDTMEIMTEADNFNSLIALLLFDQTELDYYKEENEKQKLVVALVHIDNYEEVFDSIEEVKRSLLTAIIDRKVNKYFQNMDAIVRKLDRDKFIVLFQQQYMQRLEEDK